MKKGDIFKKIKEHKRTSVSTHDQNLELQFSALKNIDCEKLYQDKMSGVRSDRPGLQQAVVSVGAGDMNCYP